MDKIAADKLRLDLYQACGDVLALRKQNALQALSQATEASNDDTKSSAGDKYETTREMMQQEIDRNKKALYEAGMQEQSLKHAVHIGQDQFVEAGSIVETTAGSFYLSIGLGQIRASDRVFIALSPASPLGRQFMGATVGQEILFNGQIYRVLQIC